MGIVNLHRIKTLGNIFSFVAFQLLQRLRVNISIKKIVTGQTAIKRCGTGDSLSRLTEVTKSTGEDLAVKIIPICTRLPHQLRLQPSPFSGSRKNTSDCTCDHYEAEARLRTQQATQSSGSSGPRTHEESRVQHQRPIIKASIKSRKNFTPSVLRRKQYDLY